jgi:hypothetical protein
VALGVPVGTVKSRVHRARRRFERSGADAPRCAAAARPVARLLVAALPGAIVAEPTLDAPFDRVWRVVSDLEVMVARYEPSVHAVEVVDRKGERAHVVVTLRGGHREPMQVRLVPGWCLMHSASTLVAFAARPAGERTVLAHLEHDRRPPRDGDGPRIGDAGKLVRELETIEALASQLDGS